MKALIILSVTSLALLFPRKGNINGNRNGTYYLIETQDKHQGKALRGSTPPPPDRRPRVSNKAFSLNENEQGQLVLHKKYFPQYFHILFRM